MRWNRERIDVVLVADTPFLRPAAMQARKSHIGTREEGETAVEKPPYQG